MRQRLAEIVFITEFSYILYLQLYFMTTQISIIYVLILNRLTDADEKKEKVLHKFLKSNHRKASYF